MRNNLTIVLTIALAAAFLLAGFIPAAPGTVATVSSAAAAVTPIPYSTDDGATFPIMNLGVLTPSPDQFVRVTITNTTNRNSFFRFRRDLYEQTGCNGGVCSGAIISQSTTPPVVLGPHEAASIDIHPTGFGIGGVVATRREFTTDLVIDILGIDSATGRIRWTAPSTDIGLVRF